MNTQIPRQPDIGNWPNGKWAVRDWPVNEIVLQSLVLAGRTDQEIALIYDVDSEAVADLRAKFGL